MSWLPSYWVWTVKGYGTVANGPCQVLVAPTVCAGRSLMATAACSPAASESVWHRGARLARPLIVTILAALAFASGVARGAVPSPSPAMAPTPPDDGPVGDFSEALRLADGNRQAVGGQKVGRVKT